MFKRMYRLRGNIRFEKPFLFISNNFFTLRLRKNTLKHNRFGFVVSKKVDKRAVVRNRSKRLLRAILERRYAQLKPGNDLLFSLKQKIVAKDIQELEKIIDTLFQEEHLII